MIETYDNMARSRIYSSLFSRRVVGEVLNGQYTSIDKICAFFEDNKEQKTYFEYFTYLYHFMMRYYRCEYVFKNEVINKILLRHFTHPDTISFSEFHVDQSIADLVMFNGISRAYEIKTDYDSDKRLIHQLTDYNKLFEECEKLLANADNRKVRASFMRVIKQRKTNTQSLKQFDHCFRQLGVATNMTLNEYNSFINNLSIPIKI